MDGRSSHQRSPQWSPLSDNDYGDEVKWNSSEASNKEQDWHLPIANVGRIMKKSLPANAKISKEAKGIIQECVSEFIGFVTGEASDKCQREKRKTINGDDLLWAMATLGFQDYAVYLKVYMNKYRETEGDQNSIAIESDHSLNSVAKEGDRSPMEEVTYKNSLLNSTISSNPNHEGMAMNMHLSSIIPEFYSLGAPMAHSYVSGGEVGAYGPDQPRLDDFTVNLGGRNETGDADVAAALAAYYSHGVVQRF